MRWASLTRSAWAAYGGDAVGDRSTVPGGENSTIDWVVRFQNLITGPPIRCSWVDSEHAGDDNRSNPWWVAWHLPAGHRPLPRLPQHGHKGWPAAERFTNSAGGPAPFGLAPSRASTLAPQTTLIGTSAAAQHVHVAGPPRGSPAARTPRAPYYPHTHTLPQVLHVAGRHVATGRARAQDRLRTRGPRTRPPGAS